jgi:fatty-acyl-CoA synthase
MPKEDAYTLASKQGRPACGVELRVVDDTGTDVPHDGKSYGELLVRGPWISAAYFEQDEDTSHTPDGWLHTGDVVTVDASGYVLIVDRVKDLIKSGGEWISSITLENLAMGHPKVGEAAAVPMRHPKWDERPLLVIVPKDDSLTGDELLAHLEGKVARWWLPDDVIFVEELPHTATGKIMKRALRERYRDHLTETRRD